MSKSKIGTNETDWFMRWEHWFSLLLPWGCINETYISSWVSWTVAHYSLGYRPRFVGQHAGSIAISWWLDRIAWFFQMMPCPVWTTCLNYFLFNMLNSKYENVSTYFILNAKQKNNLPCLMYDQNSLIGLSLQWNLGKNKQMCPASSIIACNKGFSLRKSDCRDKIWDQQQLWFLLFSDLSWIVGGLASASGWGRWSELLP